MSSDGLEACLLVLLLVVVAGAMVLQVVASARWSPRSSGLACVGGAAAVGVVSAALLAAYAGPRGGADVAALLVAASIPAGGWIVLAVVVHFGVTLIRRYRQRS